LAVSAAAAGKRRVAKARILARTRCRADRASPLRMVLAWAEVFIC
jgi:hypothetical protein